MEGGLVWIYYAQGPGLHIAIGMFFAIAVVSFFGMLFLSRNLRVPAGTFDDGDVRLAIASSIIVTFFTVLSYGLFSFTEENKVTDALLDQVFTLTGVVVAFYFATTGAVEIFRIREQGRTARHASEEQVPEGSGATSEGG